jgi:hypothetical protein
MSNPDSLEDFSMMTENDLHKQLIAAALPKPEVLVGFDIGQVHDPSGIVLVDRYYVPTSDLYTDDESLRSESSWVNVERRYDVTEIDTWKDVPYQTQVDRIIKLMLGIEEHVTLAVDATGCGRPVVEMLYAEINRVKWYERGYKPPSPAFIQIHGGNTVTRNGAILNVPKRDLCSAPLVLFQNEMLNISEDLEHAATLKRELLKFKVKINIATGHDAYEAWRENDHDDLVLALAMACWVAERFLYKPDRVEVPGIVIPDAPVFTYG